MFFNRQCCSTYHFQLLQLQFYRFWHFSSCKQRRNYYDNGGNSNIYSSNIGKKAAEPSRALRVAIIGCPNVGKSALTNALVRNPVCAVSKLIDTTKANATAILTENECQLCVVDSPGLISLSHAKDVVKTHFDDTILTHPEKAIEHSELVLVVQDVTAPGKYLQHRLLYLLHRYAHIPALLVLNKVDLLHCRSDLLPLTDILTEGIVGGVPIQTKKVGLGIIGTTIERARKKQDKTAAKTVHEKEMDTGLRPMSAKMERNAEWHALYNKLLLRPPHKANWTDTRKLFIDQPGWPHFQEVFFVSAKTGEGVDHLRAYLRQNSIEREWHFEAELISKKSPQALCAEHIRSALLNNCPAFMAYKLRVKVAEWEEDKAHQLLRIAANVHCDHEREAHWIWYRLQDVELQLREHLQTLFRCNVVLHLFIRVRGQRDVYQPDPVIEERRRLRRQQREAARKAADEAKEAKPDENGDEQFDDDDEDGDGEEGEWLGEVKIRKNLS